FTEGAACDPQGNVFFTDQPSDRILEWTTNETLVTYMHPCGRANGLCFDARGNLYACADAKNELWRIAPDRTVTVLVRGYQGKLLNGPNDVWVSPRGSLFFTDPYYKRDYWERGPSALPEVVYSLSEDGKTLKPAAEDVKKPNGIVGTPNGKILYVADIGAGKTFRYRIKRDGSLVNQQLFCEMGSDGMTMDERGDVYLSGKGVFVFDPKGTQLEHIQVPEAWVGNVCFGGTDHRTLFVTASRGFYSVRMSVKGAGSQ
ncbi:MAG TPA: SMP-30/gluconolactonase/LRE family protein, partial [Verrucomicrobiae bacterium]|nr:SMP-30/gluconolactonase/LRE family protein [Verrucomicrobiae bacterium]